MKQQKIKLVLICLFFLSSFGVHAQSVKDIDGNVYKTVTIGNQVWLTENLNTTHYRNGDPIPEVKTAAEWEDCYRKEKGAWCYYNNNPSNGKKYGKLYNWYAVNDSRGIAPVGTHVPSKKE